MIPTGWAMSGVGAGVAVASDGGASVSRAVATAAVDGPGEGELGLVDAAVPPQPAMTTARTEAMSRLFMSTGWYRASVRVASRFVRAGAFSRRRAVLRCR